MYYGEFGLKGCQRHKTPDDGGGGGEGTRDYIHIFIITECIKNNLFPKQINSAEYEYVNIRICVQSPRRKIYDALCNIYTFK